MPGPVERLCASFEGGFVPPGGNFWESWAGCDAVGECASVVLMCFVAASEVSADHERIVEKSGTVP